MPSRQAGRPCPRPCASVFKNAFALEMSASGWPRHVAVPGQGEEHGLRGRGGLGAVSRITSWALPLPLETADLGGVFVLAYFPWLSTPKGFCLVYPNNPSRGSRGLIGKC